MGTSLQTVLEESTVTDFSTRPIGPDLLGILIEEIAGLRDSIQTPQSHLHAANHIHNNELIFTAGYSQGVIEFFCEVRYWWHADLFSMDRFHSSALVFSSKQSHSALLVFTFSSFRSPAHIQSTGQAKTQQAL